MLDYALKPAGYYSAVRQDILVHVPLGPNRVLDIGCGEGLMARALKQDGKAAWVAGVEMFPEAAADAKAVVDELVVGDLETVDLPFERQSLDVILLGDVLEHLRDPWRQLERLAVFLKPGGLVIASVPNVRNWRVVFSLALKGRWDYASLGIMDRTHLRFFTRSTLLDLVRGAGLAVESCQPTGNYAPTLAKLRLTTLAELLAFQFVVVGRRV
jgi:2-polyprenyl-3-methyl-5-hydroxy-6-metoxy-1,4-benzoquinol methylase